jgi:hypothetical protein
MPAWRLGAVRGFGCRFWIPLEAQGQGRAPQLRSSAYLSALASQSWSLVGGGETLRSSLRRQLGPALDARWREN